MPVTMLSSPELELESRLTVCCWGSRAGWLLSPSALSPSSTSHKRGHSQHGLALLSHRAAPIELLRAGKAITKGGHSSSERDGARDEQRILQCLLARQKSVAQQYEQGTSPRDLHHCSVWL